MNQVIENKVDDARKAQIELLNRLSTAVVKLESTDTVAEVLNIIDGELRRLNPAWPLRMERIYVGRKIGCMCGCNGKYYQHDGSAASARAFAKVCAIINEHQNDLTFERNEPNYLYVEVDGRPYCAYMKAEVL